MGGAELALKAQCGELTEHHVYRSLAKRAQGKNRQILEHIAADELRHYGYWRKSTGQDCRPKLQVLWMYRLLAATLGLTFTLRLMELGEQRAQVRYGRLGYPGIGKLIQDEERHEQELIGMLNDERLEYAGSIVLGLNDGLVELTGVLAGLTLALQHSTIVAAAGLVTGLAAAMSMAASGYFSAREEGRKSPLRAAAYTGATYFIVVILLVMPYFLLPSITLSLTLTLLTAVLIIAGYSFFIAVAKGQTFWRRFLEMVAVSLSVAAISFLAGLALNRWFGISA